MSGYCPGPAVAGLGLLSLESVIMVVAIYLGFFSPLTGFLRENNLFFLRRIGQARLFFPSLAV